jgi:phosphoglycolate phosphatase-like HAD superfamily hydrolase
MALKHLVLFDIDGTLLSTNGHGVRAMMVAYTAVWGRDPSAVDYRMSGKTELNISHELLGLLGFSREEVEWGLPRFWHLYPQELRRQIAPHTTTVYPGIRAIVRTVAEREDMVLGLLTGNCEDAAKVKLETAGLDGFAVGVFGAHHEERAALPPLAVEKALERFGHRFEGKSVVIIGDTPNDIACGRAVGARTIAVATGRFGPEALAAHEPDYVFPDLSDQAAVLAAIQAP